MAPAYPHPIDGNQPSRRFASCEAVCPVSSGLEGQAAFCWLVLMLGGDGHSNELDDSTRFRPGPLRLDSELSSIYPGG